MDARGLEAVDGPGRRPSALRRAGVFLAVTVPLLVSAYRTPLVHPLLLTVLLLAATLFLLRRERRPAATLGLDLSWRRPLQFLTGAAGGALLWLAVAGLARLLLPFHWERNASFRADAAAFSLAFLLLGNACEELVFRGYAFDHLIRAVGHWRAQAVVAGAFALFHVACGWPWHAALFGTTAGSLLFGLVFVRWRSLPAAVGVHVAGNWVQDLLFRAPATSKALWVPTGTEAWGASEQVLAQALFVSVTLLACAGLATGLRRPGPDRPADPRDGGGRGRPNTCVFDHAHTG